MHEESDRAGAAGSSPSSRPHSPPDLSSDYRSRLAIGAHALLISLAAGAVTALLSGALRAF
ncbi:hypothetical protein D1122_05040 [Cereibacter sphaeroides]|nr:hypothetical protein D1122_05040 [Cereibacter sphaeroides]